MEARTQKQNKKETNGNFVERENLLMAMELLKQQHRGQLNKWEPGWAYLEGDSVARVLGVTA